MKRTMIPNNIHERPGLHVEHLRQLVRLRKASGWLGIAAVMGALVLYQLHRKEPALFEAADTYAAHRAAGPVQDPAAASSPLRN